MPKDTQRVEVLVKMILDAGIDLPDVSVADSDLEEILEGTYGEALERGLPCI